jgi:hypothetical protein
MSSRKQEPCWYARDTLGEVKHQGELKFQHSELLASGRHLYVTICWKNRWAATPTMSQPAHHPTWSPPYLPLPSGPPRWHPIGLPAHRQPPTTGGLQHHQMLSWNLPRRCRQTGLDGKGVTLELQRLKLYCSWTSYFLFFNCLFVLSAVWLSTISPCWFLWFSTFFLFLFVFLFSPSWFC